MIKMEKFPNSENAYGIRDDRFQHRWLDMWGDVQKYMAIGPIPKDDTTGVPTEWTTTQTGTSPVIVSAVPGEVMLFTTAATEYAGANVQLAGTQFELATAKPAYFGIKCTLSDATQSDFLVGLCGIDTTLTNASASHAVAVGAGGVFFSKLDAATAINFQSWATTSISATAAVSTAMDNTAHTYEIYWDGYSLMSYFDGALVATMTSGLPSVALTPSICFRAGEAVAKTLKINWIRSFQVRG